jgi:hypothetical protein
MISVPLCMSRKINQIVNISKNVFFPLIRKPDELSGKVSWSDKSVQYYLHVIDHTKLAHYYEKIQRLHTKGARSM